LQKILRYIDWKLFLGVLVITILGLIFVYSAKMPNPDLFVKKQIFAVGLGICVMIIMSFFNYQIYYKNSYLIYALGIIILIGVLVFGKTVRGAKSWFDFGFFAFQPAEFARIAVILTLAVYLDQKHKVMHKLSVVIVSLILVFVMMALILLQPDFGSVLVFIPIVFGMLYVNGASKSVLGAFLLYGTISVGVPLYATYIKMVSPEKIIFSHPVLLVLSIVVIAYFLYYVLNKFTTRIALSTLLFFYLILGLGIGSSFVVNKVMKDYQRKRLVVFLSPEKDHLGAGYNVIQSKVAIGSGRLTGKGLFSGTQGQLGFLPERHTDFIFSVVAEETGFLGATVLICLFFFVLSRMYVIAKTARDRFGSLIASGFLIMFAFYVVVNIGCVMGLMPVTGLPLPMVSYGGSSIIMTFLAVGIMLNISIKRYTN
jgi:rod shape determining protein RodA